MPDFDAVICGAGAGGLALAHVLEGQGRRVLLVEREQRPRPVYKGELLQPRSVEILEALALLPALRGAGAREVDRLVCVTARGEELAALDYRLLPRPYDHGLLHDYRAIRRTLAAQLAPGVEFWRGTRVTDLLRDGAGRVVGVRTVTAARRRDVTAFLVAACDGHGSRLRAAAGIGVRQHRYGHDLVSFDIGGTGDVRGIDGLERDMIACLTDEGLRLLFRLPGQRARLYVQVPRGGFRAVGRKGLPDWVDRLLGTVPALRPIGGPLRANLDGVCVMASWRSLAHPWTRPGLVLLGDAAHSVHPMAGQGMNAAIADAWDLGARLSGLDLRSHPETDRALHGYQTGRQRHMEYVARLSHNLATLFTGTSWPIRTARPVMMRRNRDNEHLRRLLTTDMAGLTARPFTLRDWVHASGITPRRSRTART